MSMSGILTDSFIKSDTEIKKTSDLVAYEAGKWDRFFTKENSHPFDEIEWIITDACIKNSKGETKFEQKNIEVPFWWNQSTINIVSSKFFRNIGGVKENSVKQMFTRVARTLKHWADEQGYFNSSKDAQVFEEELIYSLLHQFGAFNSPVWFNLGVPGRRQAASACFISGIEDSLESIMEFQKSESTIFAGGSGSGANFSSIRSSYEKLSGGSYTTGPLAWMRGLDQYAGAMKSGGSTRNAAKMAVLDMDHPDILECMDGRPGFIRCKAVEEKRAHDLIAAGYNHEFDDPNGAYKNVMYQNANHSVSITDEFMEAVVNDKEWSTTERTTGATVKTYKARDLWQEIAQAAWFCADPGVQFNSIMNKWHTTINSGKAIATNPCSEFVHSDNTACNLCAINLTKFFDDGKKFNFDRFKQSVRLFVTSQNAIIAKAEYPTDKITENSKKLRPIGLNYGDLGALITQLGFGYDSDEGRAVAARMASLMTGCAYLTSAKLAARVGSFADFEKNRSEMLNVMNMHRDADRNILNRWNLKNDPINDDVISTSSHIWDEVLRLGQEYGYTISQASLSAPLGTISFLMGMNTTGIEPAYSLVSYKTLVGGGFMKIVNGSVEGGLKTLGYSSEQINSICAFIGENDCIEGSPDLKPEHLPIFDCAMPSGNSSRYLSAMAHIKMMAAIQPLITCASSKTINMPNEATVDDIANIYMEAWKLGVKCVSVYRDGCKMSQPLATKSRLDEQEGVKKEEIVVHGRKHMPNDVNGHRHKFEIDGYKGYIIMNEYPDGKLGEVFLKMGKPGSTVSGLIDGFTRQLSISLQYGVPLEKLIQSFVDTRFEPSGMTSNKNIRFAKSLYDYLFRYLDFRYCNGQITDSFNGLEVNAPPPDSNPQFELSKNMESIVPASHDMSSSKSVKKMDGPPCRNCGSCTYRVGTCHLCSNCGTTSGCS